MDTGIIDHKVGYKAKNLKMKHGKSHGDLSSNDTHTGITAHVSKRKNGIKVHRNHYDVLANGSVKMGISTATQVVV